MPSVAGQGPADGSPSNQASLDEAQQRFFETIADVPVSPGLVSRDVTFSGHIFDVVREKFEMDGVDRVISRDFIHHPGAVSVVAMDQDSRVLVQRQRRQPVRSELWEIPAGLLDVGGESALDAAARELYEEADYTAARWDVLIDQYNSPGSSDEAMRIFLARELTPVPESQRFERTEEEAGLQPVWLPLEDAVDAVLAGRFTNPTAITGILALATTVASRFTHLRPVDAPWPARPAAQSPAGTTQPRPIDFA
ncbi:NUDIX domain-containing protein [Galactobacter caseinivorans]|uniref:NUDIX hydrolase n=1 Tax=Galactobacter caseinivorans TaxID=2676123 RepID=A0A496PKJ8_9MICC|nr:NUDIX hydrolase [Galactobacter caseinivorans]RKW70927.1 NUDIX hydrolase [Galactobacter caseinivorans]